MKINSTDQNAIENELLNSLKKDLFVNYKPPINRIDVPRVDEN